MKEEKNMTEEQLKEYFQQIEDNFNIAVISNKVDEIKKCITSDWVLVDSQGGIIPQERFFSVLEQGLLSHSTMKRNIESKGLWRYSNGNWSWTKYRNLARTANGS
ncbi:MAG TPA: hypothetical protein PKM30_03345 [Saprospiraceae bacterium]|nr:hypothetical protein [Saprospiraceae bacterium]HNC32835.1 hypothetical protein [Bacteroidia bacterium]HMY83705.1 hypothetical protein [Saprospiraceae bacterium]HNA77397.1 hypothetical protein [Saprospiraceae bacterium]HNI92185.1 hypothetical protein [Saprospiraceae bacterium]